MRDGSVVDYTEPRQAGVRRSGSRQPGHASVAAGTKHPGGGAVHGTNGKQQQTVREKRGTRLAATAEDGTVAVLPFGEPERPSNRQHVLLRHDRRGGRQLELAQPEAPSQGEGATCASLMTLPYNAGKES